VGLVKIIPLTQGQAAIVDDEDYEALAKFKWQAEWSRNAQTWYAKRRTSKADGCRTVRMHREIVGAGAGEQVDHRNHDGLDNRRDNLRRCTVTQNNANQRKGAGHTSRYKGVSWNALTGSWRAQISVEGTTRHIGQYASEKEAAAAYDAAASALHGEFAYLNRAS
jgi:hypothetical protein